MSDEAINVILLVAILMAVWIFLLKRANGKLKDQLHAQAIASASSTNSPEEKTELVRLRERVAVLERITVEKEDTLTRDIDKLRDR